MKRVALLLLLMAGPARAELDVRIFDGTGTEPAPGGEAPESGDTPTGGGEAGANTAPADETGGGQEDGEPWIPAPPGGVETEEETAEPGEAGGGKEGAEEESNDGGEEATGAGEAEAAPDPSDPAPGGGTGGRATEVFQPTDRIPADQAVDFPWDM